MRTALPLDLAVPALGPILTLGIDGIPVRIDELGGTLTERRHAPEFRWHLDGLVDRPVAIVLEQDQL